MKFDILAKQVIFPCGAVASAPLVVGTGGGGSVVRKAASSNNQVPGKGQGPDELIEEVFFVRTLEM